MSRVVISKPLKNYKLRQREEEHIFMKDYSGG